MKFGKLKKELNEIDYGSTSQQRKLTNKLDDVEGTPESVRVTIMKRMGATPEEISKWHIARRRGISFEAFLIGLVQELNGRPTPGEDFDRAVMGHQNGQSFE